MEKATYDDFIKVKDKMENIDEEILSSLKESNNIEVDKAILINEYENKSILITGGAGSVGSELCKQLLLLNIKQLIIFDIYENTSYMLYQELLILLKKHNLACDIKVIIGSIYDKESLENVFKENKIDYVFNAAAYKHVPLMEESPKQAILTNCVGSLNVMQLSSKYNIKKVLLISSDKAINPKSVMGASKRLAEMIFNSFDIDYYIVRFGNVFNSNGSVIPIFIKQILTNKTITLTHKYATRYFMSIKEAVLLILLSMTMESKKTYVLNMGKQIKMIDVANKLIKFFNLTEKDVNIEYIGLRKAEKLHEEEIDYSTLEKTPNNNIYYFKETNRKSIDEIMDFLNNIDNIKEEVLEFVNKNDVK